MSNIKTSVRNITTALSEKANAAGEVGAGALYAAVKGRMSQDDFRAALRQMVADGAVTVAGNVVKRGGGRSTGEPDAEASKRQSAGGGKKTAGGKKGEKGKDSGPKSGKADKGETGPAGDAEKPEKAAQPVTMDNLTREEVLDRINRPEQYTAELVTRALWRLKSYARKQGYLPKAEQSEE